MKNSFVLYLDYAEHFELLTDEELGKLTRAIMAYETDRTLPAFDGALKMAFSFMKSNLDRDNEKWLAKSRKNSQNGARGGRPKAALEENQTVKEESEKSERFSEEPKKAVNVTGTVIVTDTVTDNVTDTEKKKNKKEKSKYADDVFMTEDEYQKLCDRFGKPEANSKIEDLSLWKGSKGKKTKDDYKTLCTWFKKDGVQQPIRGKPSIRDEIEQAKREVAEGIL